MKKYKFNGVEKVFLGVTLKQIVCVTAFSSVSVNEIGGWLEKESSLEQSGNAWVYKDAKIYGDARVSGNAKIYGNARVYGDARVSGGAQVYGYARVSGGAWVYGYVEVYGYAQVYGNAKIYGNARVSGDAQVYGSARVSRDALSTSKVKTINSQFHHVTITDSHIQIGCKMKTIKQWGRTTVKQVLEMDGEISAKAWKKSKPFIMMLAGE